MNNKMIILKGNSMVATAMIERNKMRILSRNAPVLAGKTIFAVSDDVTVKGRLGNTLTIAFNQNIVPEKIEAVFIFDEDVLIMCGKRRDSPIDLFQKANEIKGEEPEKEVHSKMLGDILSKAESLFPDKVEEEVDLLEDTIKDTIEEGHTEVTVQKDDKNSSNNNNIKNPFPSVFPGSSWQKVEYGRENDKFYLVGHFTRGKNKFIIEALPGIFSNKNHAMSAGFTRFVRSIDGTGFWVRVRL